MAEQKRKKERMMPLRIFLSETDYAAYQKLETALCVAGKDVNKYLAEKIGEGIYENYSTDYDGLVSGEELLGEVEKRFGGKVLMKNARMNLMGWRNSLWTEGVDYYSAARGSSRIFRYDVEKCLAKLADSFGEKMK